ncbi:DUF5667 domain-containing protein [Solicola sp. PLA-1-18]|uniref:DUF5667 domain-containing protein n=1 Tax=Solicola sp. PLA-1-18 TaxID=3380532 RepID=UPI003B7FB026
MRRQQREQARADALARALDGRPVRDRTLAAETDELVRVAEAILRAEHPQPDPAFASDLRERLVAEARTSLAVAPRRVVHVRPVHDGPTAVGHRRGRALVAAVVVAAGSFGLVATSAQALPGETLYPVKRGVERVELATQRGPEGTGQKQLELASERLAEVDALARDGVSGREARLVDDTLADFSSSARAGSVELLGAYRDRGTAVALERVDTFTQDSRRTLTSLEGRLPDTSAASFADATSALSSIVADTTRVCDDCVAVVPSTGSDDDASAGFAQPAPTAPTPSAPSVAPSGDGDQQVPSVGDLPEVVVPTPSATVPSTPTPTLPRPTDPVGGLTDPLLGGLLGQNPDGTTDSGRPALVPGLLDGLLGNR